MTTCATLACSASQLVDAVPALIFGPAIFVGCVLALIKIADILTE